MTTRSIGEPVARVEDDRLVTGRGKYVDDVLPGALEMAVLRSPHAHAKILSIEIDEVLDLEGVHAVYTYEDLPGSMAEPLPLLIPHPTLTHGRTQYALAHDEVNYVGEAIAVVVADDRYIAEDAVDRIRVEYQPLTPVVGIDNARRAEQLVHEDVPGNVAARMEQGFGDARGAIEAAPNRLVLEVEIERSASTRSRGAERSRAGIATWAGSACGAPRRTRPGCAPRSHPNSAWISAASTSSPPTWEAVSASK